MRIVRSVCISVVLFMSDGRQEGQPPLWLGADNRPNALAREALTLLSEADTHGLSPAYYQPGPQAMAGGARFEQELTQGLTRYLEDLSRGRVDPRTLGLGVEARDDAVDVVAALRQSAGEGRLRDLVSDLAPRTDQYRALQAALVGYRALALQTSLPSLPVMSSPIRPGQPFSGAVALHARLLALGDLEPGTRPPIEAALTGPLIEGVKRFQTRHGLTADGILGRRTIAALAVPPAVRVRQVELALERLRWLPRAAPDRVIVVNIPMFRLWALEAGSRVAPVSMRVIVGRAMRTQTPVFTADLRAVVFRPYWNVPLSIARSEVVPRIRRDPGYLVRSHFEIVRGDGDEAAIVPPTPEALDQVARGALRIRQRPGPDNALGLIKFDLPNPFGVYLHGTPAVQLFGQDQRDFSHGCVRVEDPAALARWVLDDPAWTPEAVIAAASDATSRAVAVARATRVWLFYTTAVALPDGTVHFADDVYQQDARLQRAMERVAARTPTNEMGASWRRGPAGE